MEGAGASIGSGAWETTVRWQAVTMEVWERAGKTIVHGMYMRDSTSWGTLKGKEQAHGV